MDEIFIKDLMAQAVIGVFDWEREQPQKILVSVRLFTDTRQAAKTDDIKDCIDYDETANQIRTFIEKSARFTLEALAEDIARLCLTHTKIKNVIIRIEKPGIVKGTSSVGIQIER